MGSLWFPFTLGSLAILVDGDPTPLSRSLHPAMVPSSYFLRYTLILWESTGSPPHFTMLSHINDQPIIYYDSHLKEVFARVDWIREAEAGDPDIWEKTKAEAMALEQWLWIDLATLKSHTVNTETMTLQMEFGCEKQKTGYKSSFCSFAFNGRGFFVFDSKYGNWTATDAEAQIFQAEWNTELLRNSILKSFLTKECFSWLDKCFKFSKGVLRHTAFPTAKVSHKVNSDGQATLICRIYGFYPKDIIAIWEQDGEITEKTIVRGGVFPNSDWTYHTWISIVIDSRDWNKYQCQVRHISLKKPLKVVLIRPLSIGSIAGSLVGIFLLLFVVSGFVIYIQNRRDIKGDRAKRRLMREERERTQSFREERKKSRLDIDEGESQQPEVQEAQPKRISSSVVKVSPGAKPSMVLKVEGPIPDHSALRVDSSLRPSGRISSSVVKVSPGAEPSMVPKVEGPIPDHSALRVDSSLRPSGRISSSGVTVSPGAEPSMVPKVEGPIPDHSALRVDSSLRPSGLEPSPLETPSIISSQPRTPE